MQFQFSLQLKVLKNTRTVYVGNLSFFTTEAQIRETFSLIGPIKRIIMGLNQFTKTPCGFCFVEYYTHEQMAACVKYLSDTVCDDRVIRVDADGGFKPGRQFGRGKSGGQVRDERRPSIDSSRGSVLPVPNETSLGKRGRDRDDGNPSDRGYDNDRDSHRMVEGRDGFGRDLAGAFKKRIEAPLSTSRY